MKTSGTPSAGILAIAALAAAANHPYTHIQSRSSPPAPKRNTFKRALRKQKGKK